MSTDYSRKSFLAAFFAMLGGFVLTGWVARKQAKTRNGGQNLAAKSRKPRPAPRTVAREPRVG